MADTHGETAGGWIGVDLDGTLAHYDGWKGEAHIGAPIPLMVERVKQWLAEGKDVRIVTARAWPGQPNLADYLFAVKKWLTEVFGYGLPITHEKDFLMLELWDDRAVQVVPNTGESAVALLDRQNDYVAGRLGVERKHIAGAVGLLADNLKSAKKLLSMLGDKAKCKECGATIFWIRSRNGKLMPITEHFISHFADCSGADRFRKARA